MQFGVGSASQLLVRVHVCDVWVMERAESLQEAEPRWNGSSAEGPISQHIYSTGASDAEYQTPAAAELKSGFASEALYYMFPINLYRRCVLSDVMFWVLAPVGRVNLRNLSGEFFLCCFFILSQTHSIQSTCFLQAPFLSHRLFSIPLIWIPGKLKWNENTSVLWCYL